MTFEFTYNHFSVVQDTVDKVGHKLSELGNSFLDAADQALKNPVIASINPFSDRQHWMVKKGQDIIL